MSHTSIPSPNRHSMRRLRAAANDISFTAECPVLRSLRKGEHGGLCNGRKGVLGKGINRVMLKSEKEILEG